MANGTLELLPVQPKSFSSHPETLGALVATFASLNLEEDSLKGRYIILGVPDDRGIAASHGALGAAQGPDAFRRAFYKQYDTKIRGFSDLTQTPHIPLSTSGQKFTTFSSKLIDAGNIALASTLTETHERLAACVQYFLHAGAELVLVVGGGHDMAYGSYSGHVNATASNIVPIVNIDAHLDLDPPSTYGITSRSVISRILENYNSAVLGGKAIMEIGIQRERNPTSRYSFALDRGITIVEYSGLRRIWNAIASGRQVTCLEHVQDHLDICSHLGWKGRVQGSLHVSLAMDVISSSIAVGTTSATPIGAPVSDIWPALAFLARSRTCKVFDLVELCPPRDVGEQTSQLAAALMYDFLLVREEYGLR